MPTIDTRALLVACSLAAAQPGAFAQADTTPTPAAEAQATSASDELLGEGFWRMMASPYTLHYHKDEEGTHEYVYMFGLERQRADGWVWGGVYFSNSFGQSSGYVYFGERMIGWSPWPQLFAQWTAGVLYGYTDPYQDKVPFNYKGFSPGATLSLGWQFTRQFSMQAITLGAAGLMLQLAWDLR